MATITKAALSAGAVLLACFAQAETPPGEEAEVKALSGMSVLGNNEAPKSLVIVPWKSSQLGDGIGIENLLDERAQPVDKDVFLRELSYYGLRTASTSEQTIAPGSDPAR